MPGFDKTGPQGQGPMTGRRFGRCCGLGRNLRRFGCEDLHSYKKVLQKEIEDVEKELAK